MAHFLFIDESGQDGRYSPYEVLAGVSVEDRDLWNLVQELQREEENLFGIRYTKGSRELKAKKILKRKTFRLARQMSPLAPPERREAARRCLQDPTSSGRLELTALAQAKIEYAHAVLDALGRFRCKVFASMIERNAPKPEQDHLRKDYAYLFERFYYFLEDLRTDNQGIVIFDELEKSRSHVLVEQMYSYFKHTARGRTRSGLVLPEPLFVHSDLTTGIQLADLAAYLLSWGFRFGTVDKPGREELKPFVDKLKPLRYRSVREIDGDPDFTVWSICHITDLRGRKEFEE